MTASASKDGPDPTHAASVADLAQRMVPSVGPTVIAIDGRSGSGKSSLADLVAQRLEDALVLHMDDLFPGWDGLAASPALLVVQVLVPIRRSEPAAYRRFDWGRSEFAESVAVAPCRNLIVEGCGSSVGMARSYADVRVWLDADDDERLRRGLARDGEMFAPHWERWARQEEAMFSADRTSTYAHLAFRTG